MTSTPREARAEEPALEFDFATTADDAELRRLLRESAMPGAVSLAMTREPDFFLGATIEGDPHQTVVARLEGTGRLVGLGSRSELRAWVNGEARPVGYLGQLRIEPHFRGGRGLLRGGFGKLREKHHGSDVGFYYTTIIEDNRPARRALASGWPGLPTYRELEVISSLAIPLWRTQREPATTRFRLRQARPEDLPDIAVCLARHYRELQLAPAWTADDLASPQRVRGLVPADFTVAEQGGRLVGCLALWDQQAFKQIVVHGLHGALARWRPLVNLLGPLAGVPRLPRSGEAFRFAYLSHVAVDPTDPELCVALVRRACNRAFRQQQAYVSIGLAARHPLTAVLKRAFRHIDYRAALYAVHWDDGRSQVDALDRRRIPHVEIATL